MKYNYNNRKLLLTLLSILSINYRVNSLISNRLSLPSSLILKKSLSNMPSSKRNNNDAAVVDNDKKSKKQKVVENENEDDKKSSPSKKKFGNY